MTNVIPADFSDPTGLLEDEIVFDAILSSRHPACRELIVAIVEVVESVSLGRQPKHTPAECDVLTRKALAVTRQSLARRRRRRLLGAA